MISTRKQKRMLISDLAMDLEVINPIETKTVLGGDWYNNWWDNGDGITIEYGGGGGGWYDPFGGNGGYTDGSSWGDQGGGYGGGGAGGGSNTGSYGQIPNLPGTVEQQLGSMGACVSYAMSFMSGVLGHPINGTNMALHNSQTLHVPVQTTLVTGLTPAESATAIQSYFYTTTLTNTQQIINSIEVGDHGVLANLYVFDAQNNIIPNLGHEVALVGYDATTGLFMAADSNTGAYETYTANQINVSMGVYQINGVKP